ncbi:PilL N-terminal domain-containing protein [Aggregatibacter actinomycetemcomitans]|uniref:PFGI-1 class ICE element type IV pilus protein PilL2 n=1 Tax=Aggregatibacter actinomycetemcomitans TaxID=714 RepID=UPI00197BA0BA|nr:PilL N-terminal domain-containing protein [Aggregatibacter actinomycetemcomitans]MBN6058660.1 hypothetical protein [Aggregatibacter actinomycetemcomitans]MBN6087169.1 hypothetical protein [Aggregatibacter actinomycetemcomitans]
MLQKFILAAMTTCVFTACVHKPTQDNTAVITAATPRQLTERIIQPDIYANDPTPAEVLREGRYTLVTLAPEDGQKYLLDQSVTVIVAQKNKKIFNANVERGLNTTLKDTGLTLCSRTNQPEQTLPILYSRPLPKVHYQFGPMRLRDALQMLAGPAYEITLNDITRTVCFKQRTAIPEHITNKKHPVKMKTTTTTTKIIEE